MSVVIPALNEAENIRHAVQRAKELRMHEVLVVDGGSEDGTLEAAADAGAIALPSARGRSRQQNCGAAAATGDVLLFLHADNWLEPEAGLQIERALADARTVGGAFRQRIDAEGAVYRLLERGNAFRAGPLQLPYGDQGIFLRRSVFDALGGFPEVRLMEDVLLMRAARKQGRLALLGGPLHVCARRWQRHGVVRQTLRNWGLLAGLCAGVPPDRLAKFYPPHAGS